MLVELLEKTEAQHGARTALVWRGERASWAELARAVRGRAAELAERGVEPGRAVALLLSNCPDFVVDLFAIAARGAAAVPLNPRFGPEEVGACLRGCDLAAIVSEPAAEAVARRVAEDSDGAVLETRGGADALAAPVAAAGAGPVAGEDVLYGFSSGSTGTPKRIVRTQAQLVAEADGFAATVGVGAEDVILGVVPFFHAHGLGNCVLAAVRSGATLVIEPAFEPRSALATLAAEHVTILPGVPFIFRMLSEVRAAEAFDPSALRLCFSAGAPLPEPIFAAFGARFDRPLRQLYGCSEAGSVTINLDPDAEGTCGSVGRPIGAVEIAIVGEDGASCAPDAVGEIVIASPALGRGDAETPEDRAAFREGRFFSGDLGRLDAEGRLTVTGRKKLYISTAAAKVDPIEVERCIAKHPAVAEVVVVGARARGGDELVKAVVVPGSTELAEPELRREIVLRCRRELADFKVPRQVEIRAEIPRSPLGKVLRKYLV